MASFRALKTLAFHVHLNPAPRTQSESNAVLRALQDLGPISTFQIPRRRSINKHGELPNTATAVLVFGRDTGAIDGLRKDKRRCQFTVNANANIPDSKKADPFNVRGLQLRKPALQPRDIHCHIVPIEPEYEGVEETVSQAMERSEYTDPFSVDRDSVLGEILAKTDCPSGLIHGLLPKLDAKLARVPRDEAMVPRGNDCMRGRNTGEAELADLDSQSGHLSWHPISSQVTTLPSEGQSLHQPPVENMHAAGGGAEYDRFKKQRNVSLMQMYREASSPRAPRNKPGR